MPSPIRCATFARLLSRRLRRALGIVQVVAQSALVAGLAGCSSQSTTGFVAPEGRLPATKWSVDLPFQPIPQQLDLPADAVSIGEKLFFDPKLSGTGEVSCAQCHDLKQGGVMPGEARSNHPMTDSGPYNVPTVFNVGFNFRYNWQGKFSSLEDHIGGPMMNAAVMDAGSWEEVIERLQPTYRQAFQELGYPSGVTEAGVRRTLAVYQRSLITPDARFDRFLRGELSLSSEEKRGLDLFLELGCASCHQGINVGGNMFQRFGVMNDAFGRPLVTLDYGRSLVTGRKEDEHVFRVPSLRNVAVTAPYFHDGSAHTLSEAVHRMAAVQLGHDLKPDESDALVTFLHTLTGFYRGQPLAGTP